MRILEVFLWTNIVVTAFVLVYAVFLPIFAKHISPGGRSQFWRFIMVGLFVPFALVTLPFNTPVNINVPASLVWDAQTGNIQHFYGEVIPDYKMTSPARSAPSHSQHMGISDYSAADFVFPIEFLLASGFFEQEMSPNRDVSTQFSYVEAPQDNQIAFSRTNVLVFAWLIGAAGYLIFQISKHVVFMRSIKRLRRPIFDKALLDVLLEEKRKLGIKKPISIYFVCGLQAPMLAGIVKPAVYLGSKANNENETRLILRHELVHLKQNHIWYKLVLLVLRGLYWYNPAVYYMSVHANIAMENVCDKMTLAGEGASLKKDYCNLILDMAGANVKSPVTSYISGGKSMLKERIRNIFESGKVRKGRLAASVFGVACITLIAFFGLNFYAAHALAYDETSYEADYVSDEVYYLSSYDSNNEAAEECEYSAEYDAFCELTIKLQEYAAELHEKLEAMIRMYNQPSVRIVPPGISWPGEIDMQNIFQVIPRELRVGVSVSNHYGGGLLVNDVWDNSGAYDAGILAGDIIISINSIPVQQGRTVVSLIDAYEGHIAAIGIIRDGQTMELEVELRYLPYGAEPFRSIQVMPDYLLPGVLEMQNILQVIPRELRLGVSVSILSEGSLLVNEVWVNSGAYDAGILTGDIITSINSIPIQGVVPVTTLIDAYEGHIAAIGIIRDGQTMELEVELRYLP